MIDRTELIEVVTRQVLASLAGQPEQSRELISHLREWGPDYWVAC